jgi:hypothetical protein
LGIQSGSGGSEEEIKLPAPARNQTPDRLQITDYGKGNTKRATSAAGYVNVHITKHYAGKQVGQVGLHAGPTVHPHLFTEIDLSLVLLKPPPAHSNLNCALCKVKTN